MRFLEAMETAVFTARHQFEIVERVIRAILVAMMDVFMALQKTTERLFDYVTMLSDVVPTIFSRVAND